MSLYTFSDTSPVKEIAFHHANDRPPVALLATDATTNHEKLPAIRSALCAIGWDCVPVSVDGTEVLQVSGFEKEQQLLHFMQKHNFSNGDPRITTEASDNPKPADNAWLQENSLKTAGWLNLVGDVSLFVSGLMSKNKSEATAGALYTAGAGVLARYGNVKTEHHLREVSENTAAFLQKQAVELPDTCTLSHIAKHAREGLIPTAESFLYRYPSEVMLGAYTLGAATMLQSGIKHGDPFGIAYGSSSLAVKAASLVIKEKHKTEEEKKASANQGMMGKFVDWVQEKPLRIFGFGSMISEILLGLSALREHRVNPKQQSYIFKFITTGTYLASDLMMAISHKNPTNTNGRFDPDEQRYIVGLAAEAIAHQPKEQQAALIQNAAGFLTTQPEMNGKAMDIAKAIQEQVAHMNSNPWTRRMETTTLSPPMTSNR